MEIQGLKRCGKSNCQWKLMPKSCWKHQSSPWQLLQIPCLIHHGGCCKVSRAMQKSLEVCHVMLPEDTAQRSLMSWFREECNAKFEAVQKLLLKLGPTGTSSQISLTHDQNAYIVQYMEKGNFLVLLFGKNTLKFNYTQLFQCWIPYCYIAPREDVPGKMRNIEFQIQVAATVASVVGSSQVSPPQPCRGLQASTTRFKAAHLALCRWQNTLHHTAPRGNQCEHKTVITPWPCWTSLCIAA